MNIISTLQAPEHIKHRDKMDSIAFPFSLAVTKMLSKGEAKLIPEAMEAMRKSMHVCQVVAGLKQTDGAHKT